MLLGCELTIVSNVEKRISSGIARLISFVITSVRLIISGSTKLFLVLKEEPKLIQLLSRNISLRSGEKLVRNVVKDLFGTTNHWSYS